MKKYFFTFGSNHFVPKGMELEGKCLFRYYVTIEAEDTNTARQIMFNRYGDKWSFCYPENQFDSAIGQFNLTEFEHIIQEQPAKKS